MRRHWLPRTIFSTCVGLAPKAESKCTFLTELYPPKLSRTMPGGDPGCGMAPPSSSGHCWKEKRKDPVEPSLNSGLKAICHQSASVFKTTRSGLCPLSRVEATQKLPPLDSTGGWVCHQCCLICNATDTDVQSHVQVPLVLSFFLNTGLFLALN